jgi:hypothetical protein
MVNIVKQDSEVKEFTTEKEDEVKEISEQSVNELFNSINLISRQPKISKYLDNK